MQPIREESEDPVLGEFVVPSPVTAEDVRVAVVAHGRELWPAGSLCRNCRVPFPCRLHRWGRRVLAVRGLTDCEIDELVERGVAVAFVRNRMSAVTTGAVR